MVADILDAWLAGARGPRAVIGMLSGQQLDDIERQELGFAEWVAYVYLEGMLASFTDSEEARAAKFYMKTCMEENPDPIYGKGLQAFLKLGGFSERAKIMQLALTTNVS